MGGVYGGTLPGCEVPFDHGCDATHQQFVGFALRLAFNTFEGHYWPLLLYAYNTHGAFHFFGSCAPEGADLPLVASGHAVVILLEVHQNYAVGDGVGIHQGSEHSLDSAPRIVLLQ